MCVCVCARPVAYIFFDARKRNPRELEASRVFPVESSAKQFRQGMRFPRYLGIRGYSLPRRDRLNQFQLPLYTLTRFRGRISKVCKATDLDFHGNLDALRLPTTVLLPSISTLLTLPISFREQQQPKKIPSLIYSLLLSSSYYFLSSLL